MSKIEVPKKRPNYFNVYNKDKYVEVKYLSQQEIADGWEQVIPYYKDKRLHNQINVTLAFLPEKFWYRLKKRYNNNEESYKTIKDGLTHYTIIESNQDEVMFLLFKEIHKFCPNKDLIQSYIDNIDPSQYTSWLILRAKHIILHNKPYFPELVTELKLDNVKAVC
jgi:hypothetical protein